MVRRRRCAASSLTDKAHVADLFLRCAESYGVKRAERAMGFGFRDHQMPTRDQFAEAVEELGLRAIRSLRQHEMTMCRCARLRATIWWAIVGCRSKVGTTSTPTLT